MLTPAQKGRFFRLRWAAFSLGALAATYFYVYSVMQIPTRVLADALGPRKPMIVAGALVYCLIWLLLFGWRLSPAMGYALFIRETYCRYAHSD